MGDVQLSPTVLAVDVVCFQIDAAAPTERALSLLVVQRSNPPYAGQWALPGGIVAAHERLDEAAHRILRLRTGLVLPRCDEAQGAYIEQLYTFGDPGRDPRGRTVSVAYYALLPLGEAYAVHAETGVEAVAWQPVGALPPLAFDHTRIAAYAHRRLKAKISYAPLVFRVMPDTFTMGDLRRQYEKILGTRLHPSNFTRQMLARWDIAPVSGVHEKREKRRPARVYRYTGSLDVEGEPTEMTAAGAPSEA
ncbi:MAG TPA: NUDIX domain-containing protein [Chloroflexota bacterium]|jgi:8-oxo-dGTP diphosphatase|nr:NUDIX domain-containing protein [Chloroflexota bacterium]